MGLLERARHSLSDAARRGLRARAAGILAVATGGTAPGRRGLLERAMRLRGAEQAGSETRVGLLTRAARLRARVSVVDNGVTDSASPAAPVAVASAVTQPGDALAEMQRAFERREFDLENLFEISKEINSTLNLRDLFSIVIFIAMGQTGSARVFLCTRDPLRDGLRPQAARGIEDAVSAALVFPGDGMLASALLEADAPFTVAERGTACSAAENAALTAAGIELLVPLVNQGALVGCLGLGGRHDGGGYPQGDRDFLATLGALAAIALENARLYGDLESKLRQLSALYDISRIINSSDQLEQVLDLAVETLSTGFHVSRAVFLLEDPSGLRAVRTLAPEQAPDWPSDSPWALAAYEAGEALDMPGFRNEAELAALFPLSDAQSLLLVPLLAAGTRVGILAILGIEGRAPGPFTREEKELFSIIASQIAPPLLVCRRLAVEREAVRDPFTPYLTQIEQALSQAEEFSLSLGIGRLRLEGVAGLIATGREAVPALVERVGAAVRAALDEKYRMIRSGPAAYTLLFPGLPVREQAALLAGARVAAENFLAGLDLSGIEVSVSLAQIPEEFRSVAEFVFAEE